MLSKIPLARILIPFMAGVVLGNDLHGASVLFPVTLALLGVATHLLLFVLSKGSPLKKHAFRPFFIFPLAMIAISLGWSSMMIATPTPHSRLGEINDASLITGRIEDIVLKDFSMTMEISPLSSSQATKPLDMEGNILLSTKGCNYNLRNGDLIAFRPEIEYIHNMGNPDEMDYALHLFRRGILYSEHINVKHIHKLGHSPSLANKMSNYRNSLQQRIFSTQLPPSCQEFIVALILGNKSFIDYDTRQQFANAGIAHILALSGLHVGIIAAIFWWVLFPLDFIGLKKVRLIITLLFIIAYTVFTGAAPSVVRASIMLGFVFIPVIFHRKATTLNSLLAAALVILAYSPQSLFDVGFQLSFITVGSLVLFTPFWSRIYTDSTSWNRLKTVVITSMIAMISTVTLTAHYFHSISLASVITNVLVLPIFPFFMLVAALITMACAAGGEINVLNTIATAISDYVNQVTSLISSLPFSHINNLYITGLDVVIIYVVLILLVLAVMKRSSGLLWSAAVFLSLFIASQSAHIYLLPNRGVVVFNSYNSTPILYFEHRKGYLWCPDSEDLTIKRFSRYYNGFLAHYGINTLQLVNSNGISQKDFFIHAPYAHLGNKRLMVVDYFKARDIEFKNKIDLDYLIIDKHFHGNIAQLKRLYDAKIYVLSGGIYKDDRKRLKKECNDLRVNCMDMKSQGALTIFQ